MEPSSGPTRRHISKEVEHHVNQASLPARALTTQKEKGKVRKTIRAKSYHHDRTAPTAWRKAHRLTTSMRSEQQSRSKSTEQQLTTHQF